MIMCEMLKINKLKQPLILIKSKVVLLLNKKNNKKKTTGSFADGKGVFTQ
ncbi:hypothetical protein KUB3006_C16260 [Enterococcus faecalis]|nr:hypothetical protein KUB3006_C16260 [Enterococcus faecalis]BBD28241.1 hypothetical protein KUB3007_C16250 [Enterococcus faecalis]